MTITSARDAKALLAVRLGDEPLVPAETRARGASAVVAAALKRLLELRLTAGWSTSAQHVPPLLAEICLLLSGRYDVGFDSVWVNPQDGASGRCAHGGDHPPFQAASQRR